MNLTDSNDRARLILIVQRQIVLHGEDAEAIADAVIADGWSPDCDHVWTHSEGDEVERCVGCNANRSLTGLSPSCECDRCLDIRVGAGEVFEITWDLGEEG